MKESVIRVFLAIPLASVFHYEFQNLYNQLKPKLSTVKWVRLEQIHITLHFFGDVRETDLGEIINKISPTITNHPLIHLALKGMGCFPNSKIPKVLWVGLKGDVDKLVDLQNSIQSTIKQLGLPTSDREFKPHATIGRIQQDSQSRDFASNEIDVRSFPDVDSDLETFTHVILYKSTLTAGGPRYEVLKKIYLNSKKS